MTEQRYPDLADLLGSWFHQDFDLEGETVSAVIAAYRAATPRERQAAVCKDISNFLDEHGADLDRAFEAAFNPDIIASALSGSTRGFLEEVRRLLG